MSRVNFYKLAFLRAEGGWENDLQLVLQQQQQQRSKKVSSSTSCTPVDAIVKTAERMIRFFTLKLDLWGYSKLTQDITLDDLDESDKSCLYSGYFTLLPQRDNSGRMILCCLASLIVGCTAQNVVRIVQCISLFCVVCCCCKKQNQVKTHTKPDKNKKKGANPKKQLLCLSLLMILLPNSFCFGQVPHP